MLDKQIEKRKDIKKNLQRPTMADILSYFGKLDIDDDGVVRGFLPEDEEEIV